MKINELKEHQLNIKIYGNEIVDMDLVESIKNNGLLVPLTVKQDGTIISGHRRFKALKETDIIEVPVNIIEFKNELEERETLINFNKQREKTYSQKYNEAQELEIIESEKAKLRQVEKLKKGNEQNICSDTQIFAEREKGETKQIVAGKTGFGSKENLRKYEKIKEADKPELVEKLDKGEITINKAYQDIKKEEQKKERQETIKKVKPITGKYKIIYADPPWKYNDKQDTRKLGGAEKHYSTMTIDELCNMPINDKAEKDSILFLWVTSPLLEDGFKIINAWGFSYKSSFVWDKVKHNMGHYNSVRHEFLLIATKGSCTPENIKLFDSVQVIEKTNKHSEKPEQFREIIDTLYPSGTRIELFSRKKYNDNWEVWGNEV
jgi:N6-adenosine-specific RNA methylase IME4/ParB-like chromosome segregation protein Spo0J